jgi:hypothetical protein
MKRSYLLVMGLFLVLLQGSALGNALGSDIRGEIVSSVQDRLNLSQGDSLIVNLGGGTGAIKGDIARIVKRDATDLSDILGKCAVTETRDTTLLCEVLQTKGEIQLGDVVILKGLSLPSDSVFQQLVLAAANSVVGPYHPSKEISVYVYEIFDEGNNITGLSRKMRMELVDAFKQKSRLSVAGNASIKDVPFYPDADLRWVRDVKDVLTKTTVDVLITGRYRIEGDQLQVTLYKVDKNWDTREIIVKVPLKKNLETLAANTVVPYRVLEKKEPVTVHVMLRPQRLTPVKEEKAEIIRLEAAGNPVTAYSLKKVNFNILSPVDFVVRINDLQVDFGGKSSQSVTLRQGLQRLTVSFKRGYFSNDVLLYTSEQAITKEAVLDVTKNKTIVVEVMANPVPDKTPLLFNVYASVDRERQLLRPITRVESEKVMETFKD